MQHVKRKSVAAIILELGVRDLLVDFTAIAARHGVLLEEMLGGRRMAGMAQARHEAWALLKERGWSYPRIGELFGFDHSGVITGVRKHVIRALRGAA